MDMSNSTNDGAKAVLCSWKFRGDVMEMRLMAVWSACADPLDIQGEVLTGTMVWGSDLLCTTLSSGPETRTQCLTRSMSESLFPVTGIARILCIPAQNSTSCSWDNNHQQPTEILQQDKNYCTAGISKWEAVRRAIAIFSSHTSSGSSRTHPTKKMSPTHWFHFSYTETIHSTLLWQNCHKQHVGEHLKNDYKEYKTQVQTILYQMSQA